MSGSLLKVSSPTETGRNQTPGQVPEGVNSGPSHTERRTVPTPGSNCPASTGPSSLYSPEPGSSRIPSLAPVLAFRTHSATLARHPSEKQSFSPEAVCSPITTKGHLVLVGDVVIADCFGMLMDAESYAEFLRAHPSLALTLAEPDWEEA